MKTLFEFVFGLPFWVAWPKEVVMLILAALLSLSVIVIGCVVNYLESFEYRAIRDRFGDRLARIIVFRLTFPGTMLHELSHAGVGWLLGAKITKISFFDFKGSQLGHVEFVLRGGRIQRMLQLGFLSCAPVAAGMIVTPLLIFGVLRPGFSLGVRMLLGYLAVCVFNHMSMSKQDIKNYMKAIWCVIAVLYLVVWLLYINLMG